ncbi:MAG TPA: PEP/pyruvate-binding domain-containing protein [Candidatus Paceibacterota bacterium]|nr:PEP/pyruvate-binding domain-containing protein [Candidatus Paceibacterota bacterium]
MEFSRDFEGLSKKDVALAGGKGASLGEMTQAGLPVPSGFVILSTAFEKFIEEQGIAADIDAILHKIKHRNTASVERASEEIRAIIIGTEMPEDVAMEIKRNFKKLGAKFVAVRSSATAEDGSSAAWAGQLDSFLNTTGGNLLENVKRCWASLFTPRAIFYRFEKGLRAEKISVAVVVQKMVESEVSGVAFSVHPVTQDRNQLIIEASYGLGEAIVSGQVTPDSYVIEKEPRKIIERIIPKKGRGLYRLPRGENEWKDISKSKAGKQALPDKQILELSKLILRIEDQYGFPCDIEWALEKGKFYIVQSRPITTLSWPKKEKDDPIKFKKIYTRDTTYIMQEIWAFGCSDGVEGEFGWKNPYLPGIIHYMNQGSIEIWENVKATEWLENAILKENRRNPKFIDKILGEYRIRLDAIHELWKMAPLPMSKLIKLIELSKEAIPYFIAYYYSAVDDKTPKPIRKKALAMRNKDEFFARNDIVIMDSISALYPRAKHYETAIFISELRKIPANRTLKDRKRHSLIVQGKNHFIGTLSDFENVNPQFSFEKESIAINDPNVIAGEIAQKGRVVGRVKILRRRDQVGEVKEGDVIVSPMTTPDFLPAMKKALAFVTDEGGITCHAGIVARELRKPCIIGTKIATEFFKDGDMVEVDADKGRVRRIAGSSVSGSGKKIRGTYVKSYVRDFCLPIIQMWCRAETTNPRQWTARTNPRLPYQIFVRENGLVTDYLDEAGIDWIKGELRRSMKRDKKFVEKCVREFYKRAKDIEPIWKGKRTLNHKTLVSFMAHLEDAWAWFESVWWTMEMASSTSKAFRIVKRARVSTETMVPNGDIVIRNSLLKIFPKLGKLSAALTIEEINSKELPSLRELKARTKSYSFADATLFVGAGVREMEEKFNIAIVSEAPDAIKEFSGQSAHRGKVRGIARKIMSLKDVPTLKEGEILISPMTMPDYLPAMKRSAAFVTDEGGVTSHAAIIAREFKKPCVIGTRIATDVINDGDWIEVDANEGVVRVLNR